MLNFLSELFSEYQIDLYSPIPLSACEIRKPYLLEREGISEGTAVLIAVPYFTRACLSPNRNLSAYAVSRDYHGFFNAFFEDLLPLLREKYSTERFAGFADHSPIAELQAAAHAGLGVIGKNSLLITEKYSSYVFLGELITTARLSAKIQPLQSCVGCNACKKNCPMDKIGTCLSALTQKKGELTREEQDSLLSFGSVWGCDLCQEVCPYTKKAIQTGSVFSPIPYFQKNCISHMTLKELNEMSDEEFSRRAYSWRGRETIRRNLQIMEKRQEKGD
ncbi:MAG: epoxyqueuosine reductase [Ruminococcaceae bacterium]|nr:epoxyqueuosine reductase [Oscillospiraceae bacterium]